MTTPHQFNRRDGSMRVRGRRGAIAGAVLAAAAAGVVATAIGAGGDKISVALTGYEEIPAVSSAASATFDVDVAPGNDAFTYKLSYKDITGVQQAHVHFGQLGVSGGIAAFLCTNLGNGPVGTQACPAAPAEVSGTIDATKIIGPSGQGIAAGEIGEVLNAVDAGRVYVNVHSVAYPGGEVRAQLKPDRGPAGPAGPTGAAGAAGAPGVAGSRGPTGVRGARGRRGRDAKVTCKVKSPQKVACTVKRGR